jgi:hypothetical protein
MTGGAASGWELPADYEFVLSKATADGRRSAVFHVSQSSTGDELWIGRRRFPDEYPLNGREIESVGGVT